MDGLNPCQRLGFLRSLFFRGILCVLTSCTFVGLVPDVLYAQDLSTTSNQSSVTSSFEASDGHHYPRNALFVTDRLSGYSNMEEHVIVDDGVVLFRGEVPAWQLNVPLTWYFMEPVYERHATEKTYDAGRVAV